MKNKLKIIVGALLLLSPAGTGWASTAFTVSATIPSATGVSLVVDSVNATGTPVFTQVNGTALSFDAGGGMVFNSTYGIYFPSVYYALNIAATGGGLAVPDTTLTYTEGNNPNGTTNGLGYKTTVTFIDQIGPSDGLILTGKKRLIDLTGSVGHIPASSLFLNSYLRIYLGVWTGSTTAPADPVNGQPFSNADAPGQYTGTLTVSATVN